MIFPFVRDAANPLRVDCHAGDSDNEIVAMVVGGGAAAAIAFQDMDGCDNHPNSVNNLDDDDNSLDATNREWHGGALFRSARR
mmetsp:Transcript_23489/g.48803  ORF Transcript_23489/g.48803 Transcript_23489/m.48803 type:complete len:83 (-) Transcript_23489:167-415(-)